MTQTTERDVAAPEGAVELSSAASPGATAREAFARHLEDLRYPVARPVSPAPHDQEQSSTPGTWRQAEMPPVGARAEAGHGRDFLVDRLLGLLARRIHAASRDETDVARALLLRSHDGPGEGSRPTAWESWAGHVTALRGDRVHARLSDESRRRPDMEAEFPADMFDVAAGRLRLGTAIRWSTLSWSTGASSRLQTRRLEVLDAPRQTEDDVLRGKDLAHELSGLTD